METRATLQPALYDWMFVGGVVIHDQVNVLVLRRQFVDDAQKTQPFRMACRGGPS
jgi:hypothetical protein